jgi:hypothetical protein
MENWLDNIFDVESKLSWEDWCTALEKEKASWIYSPKRLREKIFQGCKLDYRYA